MKDNSRAICVVIALLVLGVDMALFVAPTYLATHAAVGLLWNLAWVGSLITCFSWIFIPGMGIKKTGREIILEALAMLSIVELVLNLAAPSVVHILQGTPEFLALITSLSVMGALGLLYLAYHAPRVAPKNEARATAA